LLSAVRGSFACLIGLAICAGLFACAATDQVRFDMQHNDFTLGPNDLEAGGVGFLTPAAATTREADRQALAQSFARQLQAMRPEVKVVTLSEIVSAVNARDLDQQYKAMYRDYLETSILEGSTLKQVGETGGVRYLAQLSLASFAQGNRGRFSFLGVRIFDTKLGNLRVFIQIWDSETAAVAWEGGAELNYAYDTGAEDPVTFLEITRLAAERLFSELPGATPEPAS
jgi:hypothetical protein